MERPPEAEAHPRWHATGHPLFPAAAKVDGAWWVMRLNDFPDHPLWTLFIDGNARRFDTTGLPEHWAHPLHPTEAPLPPATAREVLAPIERFTIYGSEVGRPCDSDFCCGPGRSANWPRGTADQDKADRPNGFPDEPVTWTGGQTPRSRGE